MIQNVTYQHTQTGTLILVVLALAILIILVTTLIGGWNWISVSVLGLLAIAAFLFYSLTVEISDSKLSVWFGTGLIRKEFYLGEITRAVAIKNPWYYGWGIRLTPRGWLFNVSGLDAVEISLASGKHFSIGTDRPQELERAIRRAAGLSS